MGYLQLNRPTRSLADILRRVEIVVDQGYRGGTGVSTAPSTTVGGVT